MTDERTAADEAKQVVDEAIERFKRERASRPNPLRERPCDPDRPLRNPMAWKRGGDR